MDAQTLKIECLKLAADKAPLTEPQKVVEAAELYWGWLVNPSASPQTQPDDTHGTS